MRSRMLSGKQKRHEKNSASSQQKKNSEQVKFEKFILIYHRDYMTLRVPDTTIKSNKINIETQRRRRRGYSIEKKMRVDKSIQSSENDPLE